MISCHSRTRVTHLLSAQNIGRHLRRSCTAACSPTSSGQSRTFRVGDRLFSIHRPRNYNHFHRSFRTSATMSTNIPTSSSNPIGVKTGAVVGEVPPTSEATKQAIHDAVESQIQPPHLAQKENNSGEGSEAPKKAKTEKELERERKKAEKDAKFAAKQAQKAQAAAQASAEAKDKKPKEKKVKAADEPVPEYVEETPVGEKKILKSLEDPVNKAYNPIAVESAWYDWWEKQGFFEPELTADGKVKPEGLFVIPAPPPNVTGALHIGHALTVAIQDTLTRWNRMLGKTVLWLPGFDHAGISTQNVIEKMLWKKEQKTRHDLGREEFLRRAWIWKEDYHQRIKGQLKKMGASVDWSREAFTMNPQLTKAVVEAFVRLHDEGIIYRANRLVNWCVRLNTTLSNLEVEQVQLEGKTFLSVPGYDNKIPFGVITSFAYPMEDSDEVIVVATTRPETMLGDTAIAVHPDDERYTRFHGKRAKHPFLERFLPIVTDTYVDKEFGTGAVKITPAHDPNDYEIGVRHKLEFINILNDDGTMNETCGEFAGQRRFDCRKTVVEALKKKGLWKEENPNPMTVPLCEKSKDVIEPVMKPQWWVRQKPMAEAATEAVKSGQTKIIPGVSERDFYRWMENIQDWCISRQLWWGHQVPVYLVQEEGKSADPTNNDLWVSGRNKEEAEKKAKEKFPDIKFTLEQDEDVLDTWFSSGLWPFSTLGWPDKTPDLENFYPASLLETGWDILFFWVARMVMLGVKLTGKSPFSEVFCHSLVRDSEGRKMSKSLGNVIDPLDIIKSISLKDLHAKLQEGNLDPKEVDRAANYQKTAFPQGIPQCGSDAMHFAFCAYTTGGRDIALDINVVHSYRKFCNKIYQATKFALLRLGPDFVPKKDAKRTGQESLCERWILHKYTTAARDINKALEERDFFGATNVVYNYWYAELCDVYIENSKPLILEGTPEQCRSAQETLYTCLEGALTMIHPFMPFVTEELWQRLPRRPDDECPSIMKAAYPRHDADLDDAKAERDYDMILSVVKEIRSLMAEYGLKDNALIKVQASSNESCNFIKDQSLSINSLVKGLEKIEVIPMSDGQPEGYGVHAISKDLNVYLLVKGRVDLDAEIEKATKKLDKVSEAEKKQEKAMNVKDYKTKVKESVQESDSARLANLKAEIKTMTELIDQLKKLKA